MKLFPGRGAFAVYDKIPQSGLIREWCVRNIVGANGTPPLVYPLVPRVSQATMGPNFKNQHDETSCLDIIEAWSAAQVL
ncbi:hypothetical protein AnigIFM59636_003561 [Aspergillus niger]|nr:hypothetical protein AnigIFM59636_003561 [Aspergillus niger]